MRHTVLLLAFTTAAVWAQTASVLTYHNDNFRSGLNSSETQLNPQTVKVGAFARLFSNPVDGAVYGQPLEMSGLSIHGATRNVVFVATENNSIYAFDADRAGSPLWQANFNHGSPGVTVTPVTSADVNCMDLSPIIGITSTPVIDPATNTLYTVAKTKEVSSAGTEFFHRIHGVNILTGLEVFTPITIAATVPGVCNAVSGAITFNSLKQHQRAALLLLNHILYAGFASHCDLGPYSGWLLGYDTRTLQQTAVLNTTPDDATGQCEGGIWQAGGGPAADAANNIYVLTGNGGYNANVGGLSYGDSALKLSTSSTGAVTVADFFTPYNQGALSIEDLDFAGSGASLLLPSQPGGSPNLMVAAGKAGTIYLINRDSMGGYNALQDNVVQSLIRAVGDGGNPYPPPVYFQGKVYYAASYDQVKAFPLQNGQFNTGAIVTSSKSFNVLGAGLSLSAAPDGTGAILWALECVNSTGALHAYDPATLNELYNTSMAANGIDAPGASVKFAIPTVVNGKVYVGTQNSLTVYGLHYLPPRHRRVRPAE